MNLSNLFSRGVDRSADEIAHDELAAVLKSEACVLVDVREPQEFSAGHIAGAINMPLSRFDPTRLPDDKAVVLICRSGARSAQALSRARAAGQTNVRHYRPGVMGWTNAGGELV
jgi:rhodanese-related sulfurtransferase